MVRSMIEERILGSIRDCDTLNDEVVGLWLDGMIPSNEMLELLYMKEWPRREYATNLLGELING